MGVKPRENLHDKVKIIIEKGLENVFQFNGKKLKLKQQTRKKHKDKQTNERMNERTFPLKLSFTV